MVKKIIIFLFVFSLQNLFASEGVITVLEAPIFKEPSINSKILQYHRKGAKIYIHPSEFSKDKYEGLINEDNSQIENYQSTYQKEFKDELFDKGKTYFPKDNYRFYKTLSRSGVEAYILKEHIFLLYKDGRELTQEVIAKDPTDYRIAEPLPKGFPIARPTGYRGIGTFGLGLPSEQSYPYSEKINDTGYDFSKEVNFVWSKQISFDLNRRLYFGGNFSFYTANSKYITENITANEDHLKFGLGPYMAYDAWRSEQYSFTFSGSLLLNFYDQKTIKQSINSTNINDAVVYTSIHLSPRFGSTFAIKDVFPDYDFVLGANITVNLPHTYKAQKTNAAFENSFEVGYTVQQSYFLGLQTDY